MNPRHSWATLAIITFLTLLATWQALQVSFDYDFQRFFPIDTPETAAYQAFTDSFGTDNNYVLVGLQGQSGIFEGSFLQQVDSLSTLLADLPETQVLLSPTTLSYYLREPMFNLFHEVAYLQADRPGGYAADSARIYQQPELVGTFFAEDRQSVSLFLRHQPGLDEAACACLSDTIDQLLTRFSFDQTHVAGRCIGQTSYTRLMKREVLIFLSASVLLVLVFLTLAFRSLWGVVVPLAVVGLAVVWTVGLMHALGQSLDVISNVIPSILLVVGLSAVIHTIAKYQEELRQGHAPAASLRTSLRQVSRANLLTALTTALGFLTLLTARIPSIRSFAVFAALGVILAFVLAYTLLPAVLSLWHRRQDTAPPAARHHALRRGLDRWLHQMFRWLIRRRREVAWTSLGVLLLSLAGLSRLQVNSYLLEDLKPGNPLRQDFAFYESHFAGARSFELLLTLPERFAGWDQPAAWPPVDRLHRYLRQSYGIGQLQSPLVQLKQANQAWHGANLDDHRLPQDSALFVRLWRQLDRFGKRSDLGRYLNQRQIRISGLMPDLGSQEIAARNAALAQWAQDSLPPGYEYHLTGVPTLLDRSNRLVADNVLMGLLIAFAGVALLMGWLFRSWRMVLIALVPNLLPLMMVGGLMGLLDIDIKLSTAIIFTISFGIAVDDTIHFMNRLHWELRAGRSLPYAIKRTFIATGQAIIVTTMVLSGGFLMLTLSDFLGTFYIGLLVSLTLMFAMLADLLLLPILLWWGMRGVSPHFQPAATPSLSQRP
jgi:hypothetical protein